MKLELTDFETWLRAQPEGTVFRSSSCMCPVSRWLASVFGGTVGVTKDYYRVHADASVHTTPFWIFRFVCCFDRAGRGLGPRPISDAIAALERVKEQQQNTAATNGSHTLQG